MVIGIDLMMKLYHQQRINLNMRQQVVKLLIYCFIAKQAVLYFLY